ncbi:hypothetical protein DFJ73DRAFT_833923 [Zopfochytrium polystomum]|nr:hypothetical protein DFJ73DRAFT_833923 [Zopfochytrium polystomum]
MKGESSRKDLFTRNCVRKHDLKRHEKRHSNDKPHMCKICGRTFARSGLQFPFVF